MISDDYFKAGLCKKLKLMKSKEYLCNICKRNLYETPWLADFHHKDPSVKEFQLSNGFSYKKNLKELEKCDLLCCMCHRNLHFNLSRFNSLKKEIYKDIDKRFEKDRYFGTEEDIKRILELHSKGYHQNRISQELFGSRTQRHLVRRTIKAHGLIPHKAPTQIDLVNKEEIIQMLKEKKKAKEIADYYGMSKANLFFIMNELKITEFRNNGNKKNLKAILSKEKLDELLKTKSTKEISNEYNCAINSIYRLVKLYNLEKKQEL